MTQRPDRRGQNVFELHEPLVTFEILDSTHAKITIPSNSGWRFPPHWHMQDERGCHRVTNLSGRLQTYRAIPYLHGGGSVLSPGSYVDWRPGDHHGFGSYDVDEELVVLLETDRTQINLFRNTCSFVLDATLYPTLASTPYWVRGLYWMLGFSSSARRSFLAKLLWIQTQMMRSTHNFYFRRGMINMPYIWWHFHPWHWEMEPNWTYDILWWSYTPISKAVQNTCYWIGRLFLGMKAEYPEYTLATRGRGGNHSSAEKSSEPVAHLD